MVLTCHVTHSVKPVPKVYQWACAVLPRRYLRDAIAKASSVSNQERIILHRRDNL